MGISWKSLFVKTEDEPGEQTTTNNAASVVFPTTNTQSPTMPAATPSNYMPTATNDKEVLEVLSIYENGLESINMPGYDFYEFFTAVNAVGSPNEPVYNMAFQMAKTMDRTITSRKLLTDAEFYISKINEVHSQYVTQGQEKLNALSGQQNGEKQRLNTEINNTAAEIERLKSQLSLLENTLQEKRTAQTQIEQVYRPQETAIRSKLQANDNAHQISIQRLNTVKDGISKYLQNK